ncbi:VanW family protein [Roseibacillus persicicus]|uniref:VanW family protein n=1 Tax=Roseibacillus persicicus TaxID=454148 RepID=UPI00280FE024|nr:VanW family protein [Roseibacillus persicicus]MDQ8190137.1 VanW family protein [Roseibacillus persicicus]
MSRTIGTEHTRLQAWSFWFKSRGLQGRRLIQNCLSNLKHFSKSKEQAPECASHRSFLWHLDDPAELELAFGKVQNLRVACQLLDGLAIPAGKTFSFWKQVGRTTRRRGFAVGRELREGCILPNVGGGLCQLSNGLYDLALKCGFTIDERHAHTRVIPGSLAEQGRDATVFWNYVDLRFTAPVDYILRASLSKDHLILKVCSHQELALKQDSEPKHRLPDAIGNCLTCNHASCFRSKPSDDKAMNFGRKAFLLDACWPEHDEWCQSEEDEHSLALLPLDGKRRGKPNYAWNLSRPQEAGWLTTLRRSLALRKLSAQGPARQRTLLHYDRMLAKAYLKRLSLSVQHLVVSQNLLPHLFETGALGGRTYDVLMTRWPLQILHEKLNAAALQHPQSSTLTDFRAPDDVLALESTALSNATRLVTPHQAMAAELKSLYPETEVTLLDWHLPEPVSAPAQLPSALKKVFFPASALARKGALELAAWAKDHNIEVLVLGSAQENEGEALAGCRWRSATREALAECDALVLPAYVENQPRLAITAMAKGIPIIVSTACGIAPRRGVAILDEPCDLFSWNTAKEEDA